jgi:hypothetical protein
LGAVLRGANKAENTRKCALVWGTGQTNERSRESCEEIFRSCEERFVQRKSQTNGRNDWAQSERNPIRNVFEKSTYYIRKIMT